ncbi:MAG: beta-ketoacyl synthase chain length factor [Ginsengibacter sp.]
MKIYIRATANISPQETFGNVPFLPKAIEYNGNLLKAIEPDYSNIIDPKLVRRMSRIIKMGVAASCECLKECNEKNPGAIITGTAYGCLEDTQKFLESIILQNEETLSPTAFIQSTHNTVGAQIALLLHCNQYNNTFVHKGFSFESALLDAIILLKEKESKNVLVGGIDELTDASYAILNRFGLFKRFPISNLDLYSSNSKGTIAGEGAAFFLLSSEPSEKDYAHFDAIATFYKPKSITEIENHISNFLETHSIQMNEIDLIITGKNGDIKSDEVYNHLEESIFGNKEIINYKHLCGEYPTSISFALWLASKIIKTGEVPPAAFHKTYKKNKIKRVLIYNNYQNTHHSLILISSL